MEVKYDKAIYYKNSIKFYSKQMFLKDFTKHDKECSNLTKSSAFIEGIILVIAAKIRRLKKLIIFIKCVTYTNV